ncbi:hypothetical protein C8Q78DRAFT_431794 [Trametes maxima]|nr:hypothetical protein C8Q78DRAFT_431794 [Trametes maxima]
MSKKIKFQFRGGLVKRAAYDCGPDGAITLQPDYSLRAESSRKSAKKHRHIPFYRRAVHEDCATPPSRGSEDSSRRSDRNNTLSEADNQFLESLGLLSLSEEPTLGSTRSGSPRPPQPLVAEPAQSAHNQHQSRPRSPFSLDADLFSKLSIGPSRSRASSPEGNSDARNRGAAAAWKGKGPDGNARDHAKGLSSPNYLPILPILIGERTRDPRLRPDGKRRTARDIFNKLKGGLASGLRALSPGPPSPPLVPTRPNTPPPQHFLAPTPLPDDTLPSWEPLPAAEESQEGVSEMEDDQGGVDADVEQEGDADVEEDTDEGQDGGAIAEDTKETGDADADVDDEDEEDELEEVEIPAWKPPHSPIPGAPARLYSPEPEEEHSDAPAPCQPLLASEIFGDDDVETEPNSPTLAPQPLVDPEALNNAAEALIREVMEQVDRRPHTSEPAVGVHSPKQLSSLPAFEDLEAISGVEGRGAGTLDAVEIAVISPTPPLEYNTAIRRSPTPTIDPSLLAPTPVSSRDRPKTPPLLLTPPILTSPPVALFSQPTSGFSAVVYGNDYAISSNVAHPQAEGTASQRIQSVHIDSEMQVEQAPPLAPFVPVNPSATMNTPILTYPVPSIHSPSHPVFHPSNDIPEVEMSAPDVDVDMQAECATASLPSRDYPLLEMFVDRSCVAPHRRSRCILLKRCIAVPQSPPPPKHWRRSTSSMKAKWPQRQLQSERSLAYRCRRRLARYVHRLRRASRHRAMSLDTQYQYDQDEDVVMDGGVVNFAHTAASDTGVAKPMDCANNLPEEDVEIWDASAEPQPAMEPSAFNLAGGDRPPWKAFIESITTAEASTAPGDVRLAATSPPTAPTVTLSAASTHLAESATISVSDIERPSSPARQVSIHPSDAEDKEPDAGPSEPTDIDDITSSQRAALKGKARLIDVSSSPENSDAEGDLPPSGPTSTPAAYVAGVPVFDGFSVPQWSDVVDPSIDLVFPIFDSIIADMKQEGISSEDSPAYINNRLCAIAGETRSLENLQDEFITYQVWAAMESSSKGRWPISLSLGRCGGKLLPRYPSGSQAHHFGYSR